MMVFSKEWNTTTISAGDFYICAMISQRGLLSHTDEDLIAFNIAKANHPAPELNHRDEPLWNGSDAQHLLKMDMDNKRHFDLKPEHLWESQDEYQYFYLETFRNRIHQEDQTRKYLYTLKFWKEEHLQVLKDEALKKEEAKVLKWKKAAEREAANAKQEIDKAEAKEKKEAARAVTKAKKEANRVAAKAKKEADRAAAKAAK